MPSHLREMLYEYFRILDRLPVLYSGSEIQKKTTRQPLAIPCPYIKHIHSGVNNHHKDIPNF